MNLTSEFEAVPLRFQFDFAWPVSFFEKFIFKIPTKKTTQNANGDMC